MRMMARWTVPVDKGNRAVKDGTLSSSIEKIIETLQPESAYFFAEDGKRAGMVFFDMNDPSEIPAIAEPLFQALDAHVEFVPVMNADDLKRALEKVSG